MSSRCRYTLVDWVYEKYNPWKAGRLLDDKERTWLTPQLQEEFEQRKQERELELAEMNRYFEEYNPHPRRLDVRDCVKRAVCKAMDMDYMAAQRMLNRIKREIGEESFRRVAVGIELARREGWEKIEFSSQKEDGVMTGLRFCKEHPTGTYILQEPKHWVCCKDGVIYDTYINSLESEVQYAWKVK